MPIYEFSNGSKIIERFFVSYKDAPNELEQDGQIFKKIISIPSEPVFRGSGFFKTDYKELG